jgi:hypothetical protein
MNRVAEGIRGCKARHKQPRRCDHRKRSKNGTLHMNKWGGCARQRCTM